MGIKSLAPWLVLCSWFTSGSGQQPEAKPVLRIETGMHGGGINRIAIDGAARYLVTGSDDNTLKVWELATGRLLRTLRPPVSDTYVSMIYAVAITPDGQTIACGGRTPAAGSHSLYLFDRLTGQVKRRIGQLPEAVLHVAYSGDGQFLIVTMGGNHGIRLYRAQDDALAAEDPDYSGDVYGAEFSAGSPLRLATTSFDGLVRLYSIEAGGRLKLLAKRAAPDGKQPFGIRFSPDGRRLAVGFEDTAAVDVLSAGDLSFAYSPDSRGLAGNLSKVAWAADGAALYAGGTYGRRGSPVVRWGEAGRGPRQEFRAADDTIMDLLPLRDGGVAFGAADPSCGVLAANGELRWSVRPENARFSRAPESLMVSRDGLIAGAALARAGSTPLYFSIRERTLAPSPPAAVDPPLTAGLGLAGWHNSPNPKLNGVALALEREISRSLAISPDRGSFALGTDWRLRLFDSSGNQRWRIKVPRAAPSVNITGDGRFVVAALDDGTIRWYRREDGDEVLALFEHADGRRWVIWTPAGYYDASPGGENLVGWYVNNGPDAAADFYPVSRFRSRYYRPDLISRALSNQAQAAAAPLGAALPPVVTLLSPAEGESFSSAEVTVRYQVRDHQDAPPKIRTLIDGRPLAGERRIVPVASAAAGAVRELRIPVPPRDSEISLVAENRYGASEPARVRLRWTGSLGGPAIPPKLYVLAVGVAAYLNPDARLQYPAKDARDFVNVLMSQKGRLYRDVEVRMLLDEKAGRDEIAEGFSWIRKTTTQDDVAMVFLSGHGMNDAGGTYYFLPANFDLERLPRTGIAFSDIRATVQAISGKALFFVDSCHAGNAMGLRARSLDVNGVVNELVSAENGAVVFAASTGRQVALEEAAWGNGAFTKAVVEGLSGKAQVGGGGRVTVNMLDLYISERVKELTHGRQTPTTAKPETIPDFPVAITNGTR